MRFQVTYVIDIDDAETPREAALKVEEWLTDGKGFRPAFDVLDRETGETTLIDLDEEE